MSQAWGPSEVQAAPSALRIGGACLAAAGAAAAPTILLGVFAILAFPAGFLIALGHAFLLGMPAYLLLRRCHRVDWAQAAIAGFLVGSLPAGILELSSGGIPFVGVSGMFGLFGVLGGLAFRAIVGPPRSPAIDPVSIFE